MSEACSRRYHSGTGRETRLRSWQTSLATKEGQWNRGAGHRVLCLRFPYLMSRSLLQVGVKLDVIAATPESVIESASALLSKRSSIPQLFVRCSNSHIQNVFLARHLLSSDRPCHVSQFLRRLGRSSITKGVTTAITLKGASSAGKAIFIPTDKVGMVGPWGTMGTRFR